MLEPFAVVAIDSRPEIPENLGTKEKFWISHDGQLQLLKFGRQGTGEDWAEKVACELCCLLGLPHAHYELARYQGRPGVLSPSITATGDRLILGNELINRVGPEIGGAVSYLQRGHTVSRVLAALSRFTSDKENSLSQFIGYLMLDAWVGNTDRHEENWGIIKHSGSSVTLAPTFDHASSLGRELTDEIRLLRLRTTDPRYSVDAFAIRARSALFESQDDNKPLLTIDAFSSAASKTSKLSEYWLGKLAGVEDDGVAEIIDRLPLEFTSVPARDFAKKLLSCNKERILQKWRAK